MSSSETMVVPAIPINARMGYKSPPDALVMTIYKIKETNAESTSNYDNYSHKITYTYTDVAIAMYSAWPTRSTN